MFRLFFDFFTGFLASAVFGGIVITSWILTIGRGFGDAMLAVLAWIIFSMYLFGRLARRRLIKLGDLLEDCKIDEYVEAYDKLERRGFSREGRHIIRMNRDRGLINFGAVDEAVEDLEDIYIPEKHNSKDMHQLALVNMLLFNGYVEQGALEKAENALAVSKYLTKDKVYREPYVSHMIELCKRADARLALAKGEFEGMEEVYTEILSRSYTKMDKVMAHYRLAEIAEYYENEEDRQEHLEYVSTYGGTSIYKWLADKALDGEDVEDQAIYYGPEGENTGVDKAAN